MVPSDEPKKDENFSVFLYTKVCVKILVYQIYIRRRDRLNGIESNFYAQEK